MVAPFREPRMQTLRVITRYLFLTPETHSPKSQLFPITLHQPLAFGHHTAQRRDSLVYKATYD